MSEFIIYNKNILRGHYKSIDYGINKVTDQNILWKDDNVFIMDNHRSSMWCWL